MYAIFFVTQTMQRLRNHDCCRVPATDSESSNFKQLQLTIRYLKAQWYWSSPMLLFGIQHLSNE